MPQLDNPTNADDTPLADCVKSSAYLCTHCVIYDKPIPVVLCKTSYYLASCWQLSIN